MTERIKNNKERRNHGKDDEGEGGRCLSEYLRAVVNPIPMRPRPKDVSRTRRCTCLHAPLWPCVFIGLCVYPRAYNETWQRRLECSLGTRESPTRPAPLHPLPPPFLFWRPSYRKKPRLRGSSLLPGRNSLEFPWLAFFLLVYGSALLLFLLFSLPRSPFAFLSFFSQNNS